MFAVRPQYTAPAIALIAAFLVASCGSGGGQGQNTKVAAATRDGILLFGNDAEPVDLDPHVVTGFAEQKILIALFEGLVTLAPDGVTIEPGVAEQWELSDDGLRYVFKIRENAQWSNGEPLTAQDFVYAWRRMLTPALGAQYANMLHCLKNAKAFNEGQTASFDEVGVRAVDERTLEVTLEYPTPYFLSMQIHYSWFPVHRATIDAHGRMDERGTKWTRAGNFVGNGPFALAEWEANSILRVEKNPHYWDAANVRLNGINIYPIDNRQLEERMFRAGDLHMTCDLPLNKIATYQQEQPDALRIHPIYATYFFRINVTRPPLDDSRVRRALSLALDRKAIVEQLMKAGQPIAHSLCPPDPNGYVPTTQQPHDIAEAKRLLADAGYPDGRGFPSFEILYNTSENHRLIAEAIQQMWNRELGIQVQLVNQDWKVYLASMESRDYAIGRSSWYADFLDPISFLELFESSNGNNRTGWANEEYDALIERARLSTDTAARHALYADAEKLLMDEQPIIPAFHFVRTILVHQDVHGWQPNLLSHVPYKYLYLESNSG